MDSHIVADSAKVRALVQDMSAQFQMIQREFETLEQYNNVLRRALNDDSLNAIEGYVKKVQGILAEAAPHFKTVSQGMMEYADILDKTNQQLV